MQMQMNDLFEQRLRGRKKFISSVSEALLVTSDDDHGEIGLIRNDIAANTLPWADMHCNSGPSGLLQRLGFEEKKNFHLPMPSSDNVQDE
jgi:hypothetical protein